MYLDKYVRFYILIKLRLRQVCKILNVGNVLNPLSLNIILNII